MMRCSVVIPTYNRCDSLLRTLDALARQSMPSSEFEVIVVDDGSADDTGRAVRSYAASGKLGITLIAQTNSGPAAARNSGVAAAKSDIIVFLDDDVEPVEAFLEKHLAHHDGADDLVVLGPLSPNPEWARSEPVWIAWEHHKLQSVYDLFKPGGEYGGCNAGFEHFYSGNASVRKKWLDAAGGFRTDLKRQEDTELAARIKKLGDLRFVWDFAADGLHHPVRSLESWLRIPAAYGEIDAQRVAAGALESSFVEANTRKRHNLTKILSDLCDALPALSMPISRILCIAASAFYWLGARNIAFACLSGAYNALYAQAYRRALRQVHGEVAQARL